MQSNQRGPQAGTHLASMRVTQATWCAPDWPDFEYSSPEGLNKGGRTRKMEATADHIERQSKLSAICAIRFIHLTLALDPENQFRSRAVSFLPTVFHNSDPGYKNKRHLSICQYEGGSRALALFFFSFFIHSGWIIQC